MSNFVQRLSKKEMLEGVFTIDLEALKPASFGHYVMASHVKRVVEALQLEYSTRFASLAHESCLESHSGYSTLLIRPRSDLCGDPEFVAAVEQSAVWHLQGVLGIRTSPSTN